MEESWAELTIEEKRRERFRRWLEPDVKFVSPEAEEGYRARVTRFIKAISLEEADRVPVILPVGFFPAYHAGGNLRKVMYDYGEMKRAWLKFLNEFNPDCFDSPGLVMSGRAMEKAGVRILLWPGHGLSEDADTFQFVEGEYMKADEYDHFLKDPSDFFLRAYFPRTIAALEPLQELSHLSPTVCKPFSLFIQYGRPGIQKALRALMAAGREAMRWREVVAECKREVLSAGYPSLRGGMSNAPFDMIGDALRGTQGIMLDMYRQPEKLIEAMESVVPLAIEQAVAGADASGVPIVNFPLHKGDDSFMSDKQYEIFYWPTFKKLLMGLINEGIMPMLFAEGSYDRRLEVIKDLPRGSAIWWFDRTDMVRAKKVLGGHACIAGNVPSSLLYTGTAGEVKEYCRRLIEDCGKGGGYILTGGGSINRGDAENLRALMAAAREYGGYK